MSSEGLRARPTCGKFASHRSQNRPISRRNPGKFHSAVPDLVGRTETQAGGAEHRLATDYPSPQTDLASLRKDNRRRRRWDPRPSKWGHRTPHSKPTHQEDHSATNAAKPVRRSIGARDWVLDASHRSNRWALDTRPDPATRLGPLSGRLEQVLPLIPIRERAFRSPAGVHDQVITVQR